MQIYYSDNLGRTQRFPVLPISIIKTKMGITNRTYVISRLTPDWIQYQEVHTGLIFAIKKVRD